jgi:hypothetical protein
MRIVIGALALANPAGTETYVSLVARELQRLGHDVVVVAEELGAMAAHMQRQGVVVTSATAGLPDGCDAILANDTPSAASLAARFPGARLVHVAHSDVFDHQLPVLVPGVTDAVVVCSDRFAARMQALALDVPVVRLRLPVDIDHYLGTGPLPQRPRRALIVSNYLTGERRRALVDAWAGQGVTCTQIGVLTEPQFDPAPAMRAADIVVAKAGAALEGMACERAVYVYDQFGGDGWITPDNYAAFEADNLAGLASAGPRTPAQLAADLADYHPDMGWINGELARTHHPSRKHAHELVAVLSGDHEHSAPVPGSMLTEIARLTRVAWAADRSALAGQVELIALRGRVNAAEAQVHHITGEAEAWRDRALAAEQRLQAAEQRQQAAEQRLQAAQTLLHTSRVRAGLALGRAFDRLRRL